MNWDTIKLIYWREIRDQLRDRRTIFTIAVMPMLLYPLMGIALLQIGQLMRSSASRVWLVNADCLPADPPLLAEGQFSQLFGEGLDLPRVCLSAATGIEDNLNEIGCSAASPCLDLSLPGDDPSQMFQWVKAQISRRHIDAIAYFQSSLQSQSERSLPGPDVRSQQPVRVYLFYDSTNENSRLAAERTWRVLNRWQKLIEEQRLRALQIPLPGLGFLELARADLAEPGSVKAAIWSRILPLVIVIWALTGAFYPAVDLCAGEKERGTLETLLSSPVDRSEIAIGKWLTVMSFSYLTSLLNLLSMGLTGVLVAGKLAEGAGSGLGALSFPPFSSCCWLLVALIPISAFLSAIALGAAAFAKSSKEGQYYLVPLIMISLPLMMIPMLPTARLDFGTSLIPIAGLIMLLRNLLEGQIQAVWSLVGPVMAVTLAICWLSIRWVICQFHSEAILFRPSEQFSIKHWFGSLWRLRAPLPTAGSAMLCALVILSCKSFLGLLIEPPVSFPQLAIQVLIVLTLAMGVPVFLLAFICCRKPWQTFRLHGCPLSVASAAVLLAIFINPLVGWIRRWLVQFELASAELQIPSSREDSILQDAPGWWAILLVLAVAPALIGELGFRGFILGGLESLAGKWQAILLSSLLFGLAHTMIEESFVSFFIGMILGVIALQTRSIVPCILFHAVHNSVVLLLSQASPQVVQASPWLSGILVEAGDGGFRYGLFSGLAMTGLAIALLVWLVKFPASVSPAVSPATSIGRPVTHYF